MSRFAWPLLTIALAFAPCRAAAGQAAPYERRGREVEAHRAALQARIARLRATIRDTLTKRAPELVTRLDPAPPPVRQGYQLLPRVVPDAPQPASGGRIVSVYSWPWTDTLIDQGSRRVDSLSRAVRVARTRADYDQLITRFNALVAHRRLIDSHVEHNRQWQLAMVRNPAPFAAAAAEIQGVLNQARTPVRKPPAMPRVEIAMDDSANDTTTFRVLLVTDITDSAFLQAFQSAVESHWRGSFGSRVYRIAIEFRRVEPAMLYCRGARPTCAPARGTTIDLHEHIARFPPGLAVLTTGATQAQVIGGRALVLGPHDIAPRTIAHEFGHLLGFDDAYLRGGRDLGPDGLAIVELIPDVQDVMASPGYGGVLQRHFEELLANLKADRAMRAGLAAMYERSNASDAVLRFREVLVLRPDHYGGTFQLAKALDAAGDSTAATVVWKRMLDMATALNDQTTVKTVRSRLGLP